MSNLDLLFANNRRWSEAIRSRDPGYFDRLCSQLPDQSPSSEPGHRLSL